MHRIHSLLLAALFFIVFAAAEKKTLRCGTQVEFEEALINKKLDEMQRYYVSSFRACRFKKLCIRKRLRKLLWRRRNYKGSLDITNPQNSMALWLPILKSGENRRGVPWRKRNTYQVVATCTNQTTCKLLSVTERTGGKKSTETACTEMKSNSNGVNLPALPSSIQNPPKGSLQIVPVPKKPGDRISNPSGLRVDTNLPIDSEDEDDFKTPRESFTDPINRNPFPRSPSAG
ncbi:CSEP0325 putative effector protein [Blumeria hordei DH14]|uniref:CSEP0325 putative effector protein n=1 Tax=Blumeria graminis f. sp. hordei (strain DH14) TaxID=546991 RepID=N1JC09_BLUG1|nr:CSEP0325 putative effector protein [Blumeria hordei DH14]